jgi:septum site-determining protein MinD
MRNIIAVHSWRGGTGKSTVLARLGCALAARGLRVGMVDASLQAPGLHEAIGIDAATFQRCLWDYLSGVCEIEDAHHDMTGLVPSGIGRLFLVPARTEVEAITASMASGRYDAGLLYEGFTRLISVLSLDLLLVDTHSGANHEAIHSLASSEIDILVTRAGSREDHSATLAARIAAQLGRPAPASLLVVNMVPATADLTLVARQAALVYDMSLTTVMPRVSGSPVPRGPGFPADGLVPALEQLADRVIGLAGLTRR